MRGIFEVWRGLKALAEFHAGGADLGRVQEPLAGVGHGQHTHLPRASRGVHEDRAAIDRRRKELLLLHL